MGNKINKRYGKDRIRVINLFKKKKMLMPFYFENILDELKYSNKVGKVNRFVNLFLAKKILSNSIEKKWNEFTISPKAKKKRNFQNPWARIVSVNIRN